MIEKLDNINYKDEEEDTLLIKASAEGFIHLCNCLIDKGADVNEINKDEESALFLASKRNAYELC